MDHQMVRIVTGLAEDIGTLHALKVAILSRYGEWTKLQELRCDPLSYADSESYWRDALITELLRKCDLPSDVDKEEAALKTFRTCERMNAATNARLSRWIPGSAYYEHPGDLRVAGFIDQWRKEIAFVLGKLPDDLTPRFSGGATYADTGLLTTIPDKMSSTPTWYSETACLSTLWNETGWARSLWTTRPQQAVPRVVRGNIFFTVPKDGTKFRGCAKEASISVSYQLDVGRLIRRRLTRIGIDLPTGQSTHQAIARSASVLGDRATIDMSNASDTMCRVLVQLGLPADWYELLKTLRAPMTRVAGRWFRLEKFSSMGNGFTFELETLIFATLARTCTFLAGGDPSRVTCYGDDLIVDTEHYKDVVAALKFFGFEPNLKKTFAKGPFRESCGGDFFEGVPVRAAYLERLPDEPQHWISLANSLRRVARADGVPPNRWGLVNRTWLRVLDCIPSDIRRCRGPEHLGDLVIHDEPRWWTAHAPPRDHDPSWDQEYVKGYVPVPKVLSWHHWLPETQLASCVLGLPSTGVTPRGGVSGYRIARLPARVTSNWLPS